MARADQQHGGSDGWPLGLEPFNLRLRLVDHIRLSRSSFIFSTPSVTPGSSSDLDTESTGSFFPERSTTLGSLIGLNASTRTGRETRDAMARQFLEQTAKPNGRAPSKRHRSAHCCCLFASGGGTKESAGPSLAHLLELERGSPSQSRRGIEETNTLFDAGGILPPQPCGAPLRLFVQGSPTSSYLSGEWSSGAAAGHSTLGGNSPRPHGNSPRRIVGCWKKLRLG